MGRILLLRSGDGLTLFFREIYELRILYECTNMTACDNSYIRIAFVIRRSSYDR